MGEDQTSSLVDYVHTYDTHRFFSKWSAVLLPLSMININRPDPVLENFIKYHRGLYNMPVQYKYGNI